jgi:hypothetical protein
LTAALTTNSTIDGRDVAADGATADAALPKAGGAMTGAITTNSTFDGRDVAADGVLATNAMPKGGGTFTGAITTANTDINGTLTVDGSNISLDSTSTLNIDNSNTTNGITIGTATSGVPISIGHTTSDTTVNDNLYITGNLYASTLRPSGDTDTYWSFVGANSIGIYTGGYARMGITNDGVIIGSGARVTTILDEDAMGTNSATALATQQSIKAYVDANAGGSPNNSTITLAAGDGLKTGGSFTTNAGSNSTITFDFDASDVAGTGIEANGENLRLASQGTGISGGAGSTLSITAAQTGISSITQADGSSNHLTLRGGDDLILACNRTGQLGDIIFKDQTTERIRWCLNSTPDMEVTGAFTINGTSTVELDSASGGIKKTEGGETTLERIMGIGGAAFTFSSANIQYYHATCNAHTFDISSGANDDVVFLPFNCHASPSQNDDIEHYMHAPANGQIIAVIATSNNNLYRQDGNNWLTHMQVLYSEGAGSNMFGGSVDQLDPRVNGGDSMNYEVTAVAPVNGEYQEVIYNFAANGKWDLVAGRTYAFVMRQSQMGSVTSKTHNINLVYIIAWDETTGGSTYGSYSSL